MPHSQLLAPRCALPKVRNVERAAAGLVQWAEQGARLEDGTARQGASSLAEDAQGRALLEAVFANSPFLTRCALAETPFLLELIAKGPAPVFGGILDELRERLAQEPDRDRLMSGLRIARRRVALLVALADITGLWPLDRLTEALTSFADAAISSALCHLLRAAAARGDLHLTHEDAPEEACGLTVLAMGKHGARELNYSSDIDLIVLFDPIRIDYRGKRGLQEDLVRLTRELIAILEQRTAEGYVFRTDLRLRPDPGSTPVAMPVAAALTYYQTRGQSWERAAMIKARPAAGDVDLGTHLMDQLSYFVWRDSLDFWSLRDIQAIKQQINAHKAGGSISALGHNVKLGRGGIREIEFFAQSQQLVHGGRDPYVRCIKTVDALTTLAEAGHVDESVAEALVESYEFLRQLEHRLQMVEDQQTQTLPTREDGLADIAAFMAYDDSAALAESLLGHLERVHGHYTGLFDSLPSAEGQGALRLDGEVPDEATGQTLISMGFRDAAAVFDCFRGWRSDCPVALESERARRELKQLAPRLIEACGHAADPDACFFAFDRFLRSLPEGVHFLSMLGASPSLIALLTEILDTAPALADDLARYPRRLEAALTPGFHGPLPDRRLLRADLRETMGGAGSFEEASVAAARWVHDHRLQVAVALLRQRVDGAQAGQLLSDLAESLVRCLTEWLERDLLARGELAARPSLAILAWGPLATRDLTLHARLGLRFLHASGTSAGEEGVTELAVRVLEAMGAETAEGRMFALLPNGDEAATTSLSDLRRHCEAPPPHPDSRARSTLRVVFAADDLAQPIADILDGRQMPAGRNEDPVAPKTSPYDLAVLDAALDRLTDAADCEAEQAKLRAEAVYLLHQVRAVLCLCLGRHAEIADLPAGTEALLLRACDAEDKDHLDARLGAALTLANLR